MQRGNMPQLANIAVISQAFCLAVALGKRFLLIKDDLKQKELEAQELAAQNERISAENLLHKTELNDYTQLLLEKTEAFEKLKIEFEKQNMTASHQDLLTHISQANIITEEQWRSFKHKFENVHTDFFNRVQEQIPTITEAEKRFLALTKLEMSNTEIASILGISPESVTKTRYRLKKKIEDADLELLVERL
jgi:DNA-binding CsgD family transcriptional regulator